MNLQAVLESKIDRARGFLVSMESQGGYVEWIDISDAVKPVIGPVTLLATGYAAHLYAWLFAITQADADRRAARAAAERIAELVSSSFDGGAVAFFEMGIAARGMYAVSKALSRPEFWDTAIVLGALMKAHVEEEPEPGGHLRKAALVWKMLKRQPDYDDLDLVYFQPDYPRELNGKAKEVDYTEISDLLHPLALSCEALMVGEASQERARRDFEVLKSRLGNGSVLRGDVLAQFIRLHLVQGNALMMSDLDRLFDFQHESGGFHEVIIDRAPGGKLSTISTLFAIQAMAMAQNQERCKLPGILSRRELAIV